jgi:hypothetical protein
MKLNIIGSTNRDALFPVVHDSSKPWNTFADIDWQPRGLCQKIGQSMQPAQNLTLQTGVSVTGEVSSTEPEVGFGEIAI